MAKPKNETPANSVENVHTDENGQIVHQGEVTAPAKIAPVGERRHRATFATDNRKGGYMIRVEGPDASKFAKKQVPVTRYDGTETVETLQGMIWSGLDIESGKPIALYKFVAHPRTKTDDGVSF